MPKKKDNKSKPAKKGPPYKMVFTPAVLKQIEEFARQGLKINQIGGLLGYSKSGWYDVRQRESEIDVAYNVGESKCINGLLGMLMTYASDPERADSGSLGMKLLERLEGKPGSKDSADEVDVQAVEPTTVNIVLETRSREEILVDSEKED